MKHAECLDVPLEGRQQGARSMTWGCMVRSPGLAQWLMSFLILYGSLMMLSDVRGTLQRLS